MKNINLLLCLLLFAFHTKAQDNYKHQVGVDPGMVVKLFNTNENIQGLNYKYNFYKEYFLRLGGYVNYSNKNSRTISNEFRVGMDKSMLTQKKGSIFYGTDLVRNKILYDNREEYILNLGFDLIFGLKINTLNNLAITIDYRVPFQWTTFSDNDSGNSDEFQVSFGESINFMLIFQF